MTGEQIKSLRIAKGLSQKELGDLLGVEQATVSRLEANEWQPSGPVIKLLDLLSTPSTTRAA